MERFARVALSLVLACAADLTPMTSWLHAALVLHGATLADPAFYVKQGNHALTQAIGLLEIGRVLARSDWMTLAASRINALPGEVRWRIGTSRMMYTFVQL